MTSLISKIIDAKAEDDQFIVDIQLSVKNTDTYATCTLIQYKNQETFTSIIRNVYNDNDKNKHNLPSRIYAWLDAIGDDILEVAKTLHKIRSGYKNKEVKKARYTVVFE